MAPIGTRAVLLRAHAYGETSRILRFYTHTHGLLSVMGRGVRGRGGKGTMTLATFDCDHLGPGEEDRITGPSRGWPAQEVE